MNDIQPLLSSLKKLQVAWKDFVHIYIYDGSPSSVSSLSEQDIVSVFPDLVFTYSYGPNIGFGCANNVNFVRASPTDIDLFLVVNPDISFSLPEIMRFLDWIFSKNTYSCFAPLIINTTGIVQYSAKKDPTLAALILSRFSFLEALPFFSSYMHNHKQQNFNYCTELISSTYLSGCFLAIPSDCYRKVGGFSPTYFLHFEDADICRKLSSIGKVAHCPISFVEHRWARGSHHSIKQTLYLLSSLLNYHRIWGIKLL